MPRISAAAKKVVRNNLLETAALHFSRTGFAAASVDAISFDAGYAKGTLYNYFRSKEALFEAVIEEGARRALALHNKADSRGSTRRQLLALSRADLEMVRENEAFAKVLVRETMSFQPTSYPMVKKHRAPYLDLVGEILEAGIASGEIRSDRPIDAQVLLFVGNLALFYVQYWGLGPDGPTFEEIPELAVDSFLEGVLARETDSDAIDASSNQTSQLSLFPMFLDSERKSAKTPPRATHYSDGPPRRLPTLH